MTSDKLRQQFEKFKKSNSPEGLRFGRKTSRMGATGYFTHPQCMKHEMGAGHPECPERLAAIQDHLLVKGLLDYMLPHDAPLATEEQLGRAHDVLYVKELLAASPAEGYFALLCFYRFSKRDALAAFAPTLAPTTA